MYALVVDDEEDARSNLTHILEREGIKVIAASDGYQGLQKIQSLSPAPKVVLLDVSMPGLDGMEVLRKIREIDDDLPVVLITGHANIRQSVAAMKDGAYDYIAKPFDNKEVARVTLRALSEGQLRKHRAAVGEAPDYLSLFESMGPSNSIARIAADVHRVAKSDFSVLLIGETGAGKELVASAIHRSSPRLQAPFVTVDCGAIPETLLESELFGHEKGSFTGADRLKLGKFEVANGGTLFLDEVANLPLSSQAKLLRAIQSRTLHRVGGTKPIKVDFRLIAATNRSLREMVLSGTFREDLYYRLCDFAIEIPSLRERKEDILYLSKRFLDMTEAELDKKTMGISEAAVEALISYNWPGNVRELKSVIRRAALMAKGPISEKDLGIEPAAMLVPIVALEEGGLPWKSASLRDIVQRSVIEVERRVLTGVLQYTGGNKAKAARLLQIDYKTMHNKIKKFGIQAKGENHEEG
ncbi:MAG TPA: sigma-54 dependent transcriptional regulator [Rectinemataceae bacterium]|nr:sigma-54 dependent transcriptional regulator [Rectinemataceae bacterium]